MGVNALDIISHLCMYDAICVIKSSGGVFVPAKAYRSFVYTYYA